jgi:hypothetical protein
MVVISIPPGFHRGLFHPSTHIAPKLSRLTVPSPSPIFTPFRTYAQVSLPRHCSEIRKGVTLGLTFSSVYSVSMQLDLVSGMSSGDRLHPPPLASSGHDASTDSGSLSSYSCELCVYL